MTSMKKGFTLIELLIVVAIIGILAGVGIPMYNGYMAESKLNATESNFNIIAENTNILLFDCQLKGSITVLANDGKNGELRTFICKNENTNSIANLFIDHFHYQGFKNPITGESATWCFGQCASNKEDGYIFFNGKPANKCLVTITTSAFNPNTNKSETFSKSISMKGQVSQC
jgi:prepilin-type N-terminal cleavage/methylation domain-containing protein